MQKDWLMFALVCFAGSVSRCEAETLADAVALAYQNNPSIQAGRYDLRAIDEALAQARSQLRPNMELDYTRTYTRTVEGQVTRLSDLSNVNSYNQKFSEAELVVTQSLYTGGRATAARQSAVAAIRSEREVLRAAEGDLLLSVITAYVDVRRFNAALGVWNASVAELDKITREIGARKVAGELTLTDLAQGQAQLSIARQQVVSTEQALEAARSDYAALVGHNPGDLADEPQLPNLPQRVEDAFGLAEQQNPDLQRAVFTEQGSRADIVAAEAKGRPTLGIRGVAALTGQAVPFRLRDQDQEYSGAVVLSVPLIAGGLIASQVRQAEDRNTSDRFRIEAARRQVYRSVSYAWNQMVTADAEAKLQDEQRHSAETQLDGMINEYRVGLRSTFDVLYAQQQLRDAEVALLASERDRYVSEATLLRQTGLLEARDVVTGVKLYNPTHHSHDIEFKNAVPWESLFAAFDKLGAPNSHQRSLKPLVVRGDNPNFVPGSASQRPRTLSRSLPASPAVGVVAHPLSDDRGRLQR